MIDSILEDEKSRRLGILMDRQRQIQKLSYTRHVGEIAEVMVEACNEARGQWVGRTTQNKTLNFVAPANVVPQVGSYAQVQVTASFPNSLVGEMVV
jgi:tRNA-2-methylthio-N6-dimethylallyladenosine synthase